MNDLDNSSREVPIRPRATPVTIAWTASAAGPSGQSMSSDCANTSLASDNAGVTFTCTVTTGAGVSSAQGTLSVKLDGTAPLVSYSAHPASYTVDQSIAITCSATDNLAGVASTTCQNISGAAYAFDVGNNAFNAGASDKAGNTGSASTSFNVVVTSGSLCALTQQWVVQAGKGGGIANSLCVKLDHAQYGAYINEVSAQSGKAIAADKAAILIALAKHML